MLIVVFLATGCLPKNFTIHGKNDFTERSNILLNIDPKTTLLNHQNNSVGILKIMNNDAKNFDILATNLSVLYNYFDSSKKLLF